MQQPISGVVALWLLLALSAINCATLPDQTLSAWLGAVADLAAAPLLAGDAAPKQQQQLPLRLVRQMWPLPAVAQPTRGADDAARPPSLASVAAAYGVSPEQLRQLAAADADLRVTPQGLLVWACGGQQQQVQQQQQSAGGPRSSVADAAAASDAFALHSRPGANHTIQLEFRGCTIAGTAWNAATNTSQLVTAPFDLDGDGASFSEAERQHIATIWQAVAQDFMPWAVDVTTEDVGEQAVVRSNMRDTAYGMRVCIGGSSTVIGGNVGGLAFTGAWGQLGPALQPVLVFPAQLRNGHARAVADAISHEIGHTLGLAHFGGSIAGQPYDEGQGASAPLMGRPYARPLSRWHAGTSVADERQDDIALISQQLPRVTDDHGGSAATATLLCGDGAQSACERSQAGLTARVKGSITSSGDRDWFVLHLAASSSVSVSLQLRGSPAGYSVNNLSARARLLDAAGHQLAANSSTSGEEQELLLHAVMARRPAAGGALYVVVSSCALASSGGYGSVYGSLGDYGLIVAVTRGS